MPGKALAADAALGKLNAVFRKLRAQDRQGRFQRRADVAVGRNHLQLRLVVIQLKRNLHLTQILRVQTQLCGLLSLLCEQGDVLAQILLPFVRAQRLA